MKKCYVRFPAGDIDASNIESILGIGKSIKILKDMPPLKEDYDTRRIRVNCEADGRVSSYEVQDLTENEKEIIKTEYFNPKGLNKKDWFTLLCCRFQYPSLEKEE
jgi:hypothetical protein